jgi:hypothetical protein
VLHAAYPRNRGKPVVNSKVAPVAERDQTDRAYRTHALPSLTPINFPRDRGAIYFARTLQHSIAMLRWSDTLAGEGQPNRDNS